MRFNTFDSVAAWYGQTKPVISKNHDKGHDVRPIGDRKHKWERIKKIDDNTYALCDGNYGNTIWGQKDATMHEYENTMAAIVWMRREDGDFIRVRNHNKSNHSVTRYNFLHYHLPTSLGFGYNQQGKHWVRHNGEDLPLPKCNVRIVNNGSVKEVFEDNVFLMFRANEDGTFTRVGDKLMVEVKHVDKELKKEWRERLDSFYEYCAALAPMLDVSWSGRNEYGNQMREYLMNKDKDNNLNGVWVRNTGTIPTDDVREIMTQEDHPMRVVLASFVIADINGKRKIESQDDVRSIRAAYNRVMNKALGFYKIEEK